MDDMDLSETSDEESEDLEINTGDWVLVDYLDESFPRKVMEFGANNADVQVNNF